MNDKFDKDDREEELEGRYANYFEIGYNASEFLMDFGQKYEDENHARIHTRIITSPAYAKALIETFLESLDRYENSLGPIPSMGKGGDDPLEQ